MPLAYLITFTTYGAWLHGRDIGSVDKHHNEPDTPFLPPDPISEDAMQRNMREAPYLLDALAASEQADARQRQGRRHRQNDRSRDTHGLELAGGQGQSCRYYGEPQPEPQDPLRAALQRVGGL